MLKYIKKALKSAYVDPLTTCDTIAKNLLIKVSLKDHAGSVSRVTLDQLLIRLQEFATPFSNMWVNDYAYTDAERLSAGEGFYTAVFAGCRVFVMVKYIDTTEKPYVVADIYIPHIYRSKVAEILADINPQTSTLPRVYSVSSDVRSFQRTIAAETFSGYLESFYGQQKQLIDPEIYSRINTIMDRFTNEPDWYERVGRPQRETFMLYGPPGTGKTNLIRHFASKYGINLIIASPYQSISGINMLLNATLKGRNTIVLFEDIDGYSFLNTEPKVEDRYGRNTDKGDYSVFLNFLDGVKPLKNVVVFMTTNFIDKIQDAIYRPGRVNHKIELSYPSFETVLNAIGFEEGDPRLTYLQDLESKELPLDSIVSIRSSETVAEVKEIIAARDHYYSLSKATGSASTVHGRDANA